MGFCMILTLLSAVAFPVGAVGASAKFKDVDQSTWYAPYVDYVVEHGGEIKHLRN